MPQTQYKNSTICRENIPLQFDEDGFLINTEAWNIEIAKQLAEMEGIGDLSHQHWSVITYLREMHMNSNGLPVMSHICRKLNLGTHGVHRLFGSCRKAWRISGLPNPGEEAKAYMT
jgi:dissimilatory sulfite reductase related protein